MLDEEWPSEPRTVEAGPTRNDERPVTVLTLEDREPRSLVKGRFVSLWIATAHDDAPCSDIPVSIAQDRGGIPSSEDSGQCCMPCPDIEDGDASLSPSLRGLKSKTLSGGGRSDLRR